MPPRPRVFPVAIGLTLVTLVACTSPPEPGVRLRQPTTELGLGIPPEEEPTEAPRIALPSFPTLELPPLGPPPPIVAPPPLPRCPQAGLLDFPKEVAGPEIPRDPDSRFGVRTPEEGRYRWVHEIEILNPDGLRFFLGDEVELQDEDLEGIEFPITAEVFGFRTISAVAPDLVLSPEEHNAFNYSVSFSPPLGPTTGTTARLDRMRVVPRGPTADENVQRTDGQGLSIFSTSFWEGGDEVVDPLDPDADSDGFELDDLWFLVFAPPLDLIRFPISAGNQLSVVSVAQAVNPLPVLAPALVLQNPFNATRIPGARWIWAFDGQVMGGMTIDACGDLVRGWLTEGSLTIRADTASITMGYDYAVAPQLGAIVVYERFTYPLEDPAVIIEARMGQLSPDQGA